MRWSHLATSRVSARAAACISTGGDSHARLLQLLPCLLAARMMTIDDDMPDNSSSHKLPQMAKIIMLCRKRTVPATRACIRCRSLCTTSRHAGRQRVALFAARVSADEPSRHPVPPLELQL